MGKYTPAQKRALDNYRSKKIERIEITVPSGRKVVYQRAATAAGKSLNRFIVDSVEAAVQNTDFQAEVQEEENSKDSSMTD